MIDLETLRARVRSKEQELVGFAQALIRVPSLNPPGEAYLEACEVLGNRLKARGFQVEYIRGEGAPGACAGAGDLAEAACYAGDGCGGGDDGRGAAGIAVARAVWAARRVAAAGGGRAPRPGPVS